MAEIVLTNCKLFFDGFDLSGDMNALALNYQAEINDATRFGSATRTFLGGVKLGDFSHEGLVNLGDDLSDDVIFARVGTEVVMTVAPLTGVESEAAYFNKAIIGSYTPGADHGENFSFGISGEFTDEFIDGTILRNATDTVTGNGTSQNNGAVGAGQKLYAALHVVAASGTSPLLDVIVQSDDSGGFGTPINRITFAQATGVGAQFATPIAGVIADTWWRANFTIAGGSPSFTFIVLMGIK